jgi:endonuclease/exonuclease/phosphatase family metal-dependent hydrolase
VKNVLKKILVRIILSLNLFFVGVLFISYISPLVSPEKLWIFAFFGLAYPYILFANIVFAVYWGIIKKRYFLISLIAILIGWGQLRKYFQVQVIKRKVPPASLHFKIMTYNVRLFDHYKWLGDTAAEKNIFSFIHNEKPQIICFQEYLPPKYAGISNDDFINDLEGSSYNHINYISLYPEGNSIGIATFSSFPIINKGYIRFENSVNTAIYSDIEVNSDTIRVYNCHLQSIHLKKSNYGFIDSLILKYNNKHIDELKDISSRLKNAYIKRAIQVDILSAHIKSSRYPVVVCGDFNDTPISYTYRKMKGRLRDAFVKSGRGIGNTYLGNFPSFRIDYIFHSKKLKSCNFETEEIKWSDHYPVTCEIIIKQKEDY